MFRNDACFRTCTWRALKSCVCWTFAVKMSCLKSHEKMFYFVRDRLQFDEPLKTFLFIILWIIILSLSGNNIVVIADLISVKEACTEDQPSPEEKRQSPDPPQSAKCKAAHAAWLILTQVNQENSNWKQLLNVFNSATRDRQRETHLRTTSQCLLRTSAGSCTHILQLQEKRERWSLRIHVQSLTQQWIRFAIN